jgi:hypothetical protein
MKEGHVVEHREEAKQEPKTEEAPREEPRPRRFRIVKLEERIAPLSGGGNTSNYCGYSAPSGRNCN